METIDSIFSGGTHNEENDEEDNNDNTNNNESKIQKQIKVKNWITTMIMKLWKMLTILLIY